MSLFGGKREESPSSQSDESVEDVVPPLPDPVVQQDPTPPRESSVNPTLESDHEDVRSGKISKKDYKRYHRWYYNDLNLVNAVEAAAANDLAHNLLGFALEKKPHLSQRVAARKHSWTSKSRWTVDSKLNGIRNAWAAWPIHHDEIPARNVTLPDPRTRSSSQPPRKKKKVASPSTELEDVLAGVAMEQAREQFSLHKAGGTGPIAEAVDEPQTSSSNLDTFEFSPDEDNATTILDPVIQKTIRSLDKIFAGLQASRAGQLAAEDIETDEPLDSSTVTGPVGLRDWSDVLAMATAVGWNPNAVERTIARCSKMFGEGMSTVSVQNPETISGQDRYVPAEERNQQVHNSRSKQKITSCKM